MPGYGNKLLNFLNTTSTAVPVTGGPEFADPHLITPNTHTKRQKSSQPKAWMASRPPQNFIHTRVYPAIVAQVPQPRKMRE